MDTNLCTGSWVFVIKLLKDWNISSPRVCYFMGSSVNSSSFAVSFTSVDSSNFSEKHSQSTMSFQSCCIKSLAMTSLRRVTVLLDSWRALIEDNISALFLKSRNNESAASTNASFTISPSWKDFLFFSIKWLTRNDASVAALTFEVCCENNDCCPDKWHLSSFTFFFLSSLFGGKLVS